MPFRRQHGHPSRGHPLAAIVVTTQVDPAVLAEEHLHQIAAGHRLGAILLNTVEVVGVDHAEITAVETHRVSGETGGRRRERLPPLGLGIPPLHPHRLVADANGFGRAANGLAIQGGAFFVDGLHQARLGVPPTQAALGVELVEHLGLCHQGRAKQARRQQSQEPTATGWDRDGSHRGGEGPGLVASQIDDPSWVARDLVSGGCGFSL